MGEVATSVVAARVVAARLAENLVEVPPGPKRVAAAGVPPARSTARAGRGGAGHGVAVLADVEAGAATGETGRRRDEYPVAEEVLRVGDGDVGRPGVAPAAAA